MTKIIKFVQEEAQECCHICDLVSKHIESIADSESPEELFDKLGDLVVAAGDLGVQQFLVHEIDSKMALYNRLAEDEEECCGECEDFCDKCFDDKEYDC